MINVLHVLSTLEQGGTEAVVLNYVNNIQSNDISFEFLIVYNEHEGYYEKMLISRGFKIHKLKNSPQKYFKHFQELKNFFSTHKYDIVHIHSMSSLRYVIAKAAKKAGIKKVIFHSHTSDNGSHKILHALARGRIAKWCDYKFACSNAAGKFMYKEKYYLLHNAIDVENFAFDKYARFELRKKYGITENKIVVGSIGRLETVKNHAFLIDLLSQSGDLNLVVFIIGNGTQYEALQQLAHQKRVHDKFICIEPVGSYVNKYYSMFDIFAMPSMYEGLSVAMVEAQANGLPVIASEKISTENKLAPNVVYLPINENFQSFELWLKNIKLMFADRRDNQECIKAAGYNIKTEAKKLEYFYLHCL